MLSASSAVTTTGNGTPGEVEGGAETAKWVAREDARRPQTSVSPLPRQPSPALRSAAFPRNDVLPDQAPAASEPAPHNSSQQRNKAPPFVGPSAAPAPPRPPVVELPRNGVSANCKKPDLTKTAPPTAAPPAPPTLAMEVPSAFRNPGAPPVPPPKPLPPAGPPVRPLPSMLSPPPPPPPPKPASPPPTLAPTESPPAPPEPAEFAPLPRKSPVAPAPLGPLAPFPPKPPPLPPSPGPKLEPPFPPLPPTARLPLNTTPLNISEPLFRKIAPPIPAAPPPPPAPPVPGAPSPPFPKPSAKVRALIRTVEPSMKKILVALPPLTVSRFDPGPWIAMSRRQCNQDLL